MGGAVSRFPVRERAGPAPRGIDEGHRSVLANRFGLQIRTAAATDAPGLAALWQAAGHPVAVEALAARLEQLHRAANGTALLAAEWGPPSGVVVLSWAQSLRADLPAARVELLLVAPEERRRGIGRTLLKAASQAARAAGCGTLHLAATAEDGHGLRAFCAATGFEEAGATYARPLRKKG